MSHCRVRVTEESHLNVQVLKYVYLALIDNYTTRCVFHFEKKHIMISFEACIRSINLGEIQTGPIND